MPDMAATAGYLYDTVRLPDWDYEGPATYHEGKVYFSLRILCAFLGLKADDQLSRMQGDPALRRFVAQVPIKSRTGIRATWSVEKRGIGWWIATTRRDAVDERIRERLVEFQEDLIAETDRRFWREIQRDPLGELRAHLITLEGKLANQERYAQMQEERIGELEIDINQMRARITLLETELQRMRERED